MPLQAGPRYASSPNFQGGIALRRLRALVRFVGIDQSGCEGKGCCWVPAGNGASQDTPWCFYPDGPAGQYL
jgi:hypothetical protein